MDTEGAATADSITTLVTITSAAQVETCGVHVPRLMSLADALQQPAASAISESFTLASLGRILRRDSSGSKTAPGLALSHSASARFRAAMAAPRRTLISGECARSAARQASQRTWRGLVTAGQSAPRARVDTEDVVDLTAARL